MLSGIVNCTLRIKFSIPDAPFTIAQIHIDTWTMGDGTIFLQAGGWNLEFGTLNPEFS
jgi:hypothetical protein